MSSSSSRSAALSFRRATTEDVDAICRFQIAMARETEGVELDPPILRRGVEAVFRDPSLGHYWLAESGGKVTGGLMITYEWSDWRNRMVWWIQSVWVEPEWRRRGVYGGLYRHVRQLAESDSGVAGIRLYVDRRNGSAQEVYRRLGMDGGHYATFEWMK
ncbi:MAG TPA: GNAT family N-acetyltransferase [Thermoanaerobaculia bacterium]|nr:GNAT family N-acetyltransferase [Thermoanaerobaculia bacterium]